MAPSHEAETAERPNKYTWSWFYRKFRPIIHFLIWTLFTVWWAYGLVHYRNDPGLGWLKPFLFWLAVTIRIVTLWIPIKYVMNPVKTVYRHTLYRGYEAIPAKLHKPLAAVVTVGVFLIGSMVPEESGENTRAARAQSLFGLIVMIAIMTLTSRNWSVIPWHTVIGGMLTQFIVAVFVLRTQAGFDIFNFVSEMARTLLGFANAGVIFLTDDTVPKLPWFFTGVIPAIIFFVALVSLLYHVGLIQWFIGKFAVFFFWTLRVSGAEAVVASATPFIGQGESAMLIRPFVSHLTMAELHQVMTCGFATIAGSVLVAYIGMGLNAQALVSSCIMSIPASIAISKMRYPETEETLTSGRVVVPDDDEHKASNALHAFANGAWLGLKIAGMIISTLLCIIAFVALVNGWLSWWASYWGMLGVDANGNGVPKLTLQLILGYLFYPVAWLLGVPNQDLLSVGELIGTKIIINEFAAFAALTDPKQHYHLMLPRSQLIATYACCGFGNIGSLGTQIGVLSQLAPNRSGDVSKLAISSLIAGIIATLTSASVAGMLATDGIIQSTLGAISS
ncbi:Na+ dependent nucleoside transporter C-terminus-domain-containing protein [Microdochium trichocladiopsis]|uniref:Na+ dependent nucleoside transporter C-terminus-domain-containing protein n=1 Tax=Microdochium trichocladiopsis TaxID=1682393 RepID=A0A9P8YFM3_9PEZI|nr:Na+ dependent nucleoside transporter C-terminus-domain-containing protein [Microdochium trichocladiopsis]KAH7039621.1 Na+ dependent nucleoside transporter C-terminus-domain-containing protein [Microdochium trichocladiopsis]